MTEAKVTNFRWVVYGVAPLALVLAMSGGRIAHAEAIGGFVVPGSKAAALDNCVEPTRAMRRYHMEYIRHQRDTTVYDGIRHTKYSLSGCVSCHTGHEADGTPVPVNGKGQFCNACHETAAVTLNCFDCHATVPDGEAWNQITEEQPAHTGQQAPAVGAAARGGALGGVTKGVHGAIPGAALVQLQARDQSQHQVREAARQEGSLER